MYTFGLSGEKSFDEQNGVSSHKLDKERKILFFFLLYFCRDSSWLRSPFSPPSHTPRYKLPIRSFGEIDNETMNIESFDSSSSSSPSSTPSSTPSNWKITQVDNSANTSNRQSIRIFVEETHGDGRVSNCIETLQFYLTVMTVSHNSKMVIVGGDGGFNNCNCVLFSRVLGVWQPYYFEKNRNGTLPTTMVAIHGGGEGEEPLVVAQSTSRSTFIWRIVEKELQSIQLSTLQSIQLIQTETKVGALQFSTDGKKLVAADYRSLYVYEMTSPPSTFVSELAISIPISSHSVSYPAKTLSVSSTQKIASGHSDGTIIIWNLQNGSLEEESSVTRAHLSSVTNVEFKDNDILASTDFLGNVKNWDIGVGLVCLE